MITSSAPAEELSAGPNRRVAPIVLVSVLFYIASLGLYTYIASVLRARAGVNHPIPFL